jgi:hypothetical protein
MEPLKFLIGPSHLPLAFQKQFYHIIWTWKNTPKLSLKCVSFSVGDEFSYENKLR